MVWIRIYWLTAFFVSVNVINYAVMLTPVMMPWYGQCDVSNAGDIMPIIYIGHISTWDKLLSIDILIDSLLSRPFMKLCILLSQKQICPSHFTYIPHRTYLSGIYGGCICIYVPSTNHWYQPCELKHFTHTLQTTFNLTGIYQWKNMATTLQT